MLGERKDMAKFSNFDYRMFDVARRVAQESDFDNFHIGCVIVYKKHIVASACNTNKTSPKQKKYNKIRKFNKGTKPTKHSMHAEIRALSLIPYPLAQTINWRDVSVYVYRICKGKRLGQGLARSCPGCMAALKDKGIKKLFYTTDTGFCYEELY